jgi:hypothetical protein
MATLEGLGQRLVDVGPHNGAHRVAFRAAVSVLVPLLVLDATDHLSWSLYAAFGAFTSLYGRERVHAQRLRLQAAAGAWQVGAVTIGALVAASAHRSWLAVPVAAVVAVLAAYASAVQGWHPPGSLFQVFGVAAVATVPATLSDVVPAVLVSAAAAVFAIGVGSAGALLRRVRRGGSLEVATPLGAPSRVPGAMPSRPVSACWWQGRSPTPSGSAGPTGRWSARWCRSRPGR